MWLKDNEESPMYAHPETVFWHQSTAKTRAKGRAPTSCASLRSSHAPPRQAPSFHCPVPVHSFQRFETTRNCDNKSWCINSYCSMSFNRSSALEAQPTNFRREDDPQYADDPEFNKFTEALSEKLFSHSSNINKLARQVELLGTKRETERVRERVQNLIEETGDGFKDVGDGLKKINAWPDLGVSARGRKTCRQSIDRKMLTRDIAPPDLYPTQTYQ